VWESLRAISAAATWAMDMLMEFSVLIFSFAFPHYGTPINAVEGLIVVVLLYVWETVSNISSTRPRLSWRSLASGPATPGNPASVMTAKNKNAPRLVHKELPWG